MDHRTYRARIEQKLTDAFRPTDLEIVDQSLLHQGHAGHDPAGETHFKIKLVSDVFKGLSAVARHRLIYSALEAELKERVHALAIEAKDCLEAKVKTERP